LDIGVLGYIGTVWPKEHSPEVRSFPPGTPCIFLSSSYTIHRLAELLALIYGIILPLLYTCFSELCGMMMLGWHIKCMKPAFWEEQMLPPFFNVLLSGYKGHLHF